MKEWWLSYSFQKKKNPYFVLARELKALKLDFKKME
jgi:hypothetical protein